MVKQPQRTDRCFLPAVGSSVARVRFPVSPAQRRPPPPQQGSGIGITDSRPRCSSTTTEEERGADGPSRPGAPGLEGGSVEPDLKRARTEGTEELAAPPSRDRGPGSCDPATDVPHLEQQGAADHSEGSRAAELQGVGSLKVTIQQSSESREFGPTDRTAERQTGGLHCHVCNHTCRSLQLFQEHMSGPEHVKKLQEITHSIHLNTRTLQDSRGCRPEAQRWCDTCQTHFSGDVIIHRQTKQHKMCKQLCRPFCPVCRRHFRTPRKFVEHMKSPEHKQQVHLEEAQEEELITVDAVGCFEEEEEEEEEQVVEEEVDVAEEEEDAGTEESKEEASEIAGQEEEEDSGEYDSNATYGRSFVVPVCGFVCQLCKKFFYSESAARRTHCRTHTHYLHLQSHRTQRRRRGQRDEEKGSAAPT
ncbi:cdkn1a interacting zinc finger protein 1b isoform X1 [Archocentrus centrarchus]|uniref:cdkn1a interacting zinc finger protein 1b isoform X1 n=1 Tax=Archocentrus centrarchus TaxID=63155 RepID=UPI0011EA3CEF|nr:cip1-interacting zinc finger protein-like isoform X1 [Archocentrus centrarchus]XP_030579469.1 cip1-interacting zinc finger protein-like isoform X1 [Archocentrus centrarchus]XP_030579471.1 cip1-interacting zinc finger protein-like isoform X1 [Archocentrus centrarchus]XP_030579472.1 cip1-interacting zinc finger protein-like isoform X1 [Archocentrus centrarchus]